MKELKGKTAVITGAGSGIGRSIALALAKAGTNIVASDVNSETANSVCAEIQKLGVASIAATTNVVERDQVSALADTAYDRFGAVDILVNNAGVTWRPFRTVLTASLADWKFIFDVNVWGVIHGLDVFLPRMAEQAGEKHIVNTSSLAGLIPIAGHTPYSASKAAVTALSAAMAQELAPKGFGVTILHPGSIRTNVTTNSENMRAPTDRAENRTFEPYVNELMKDELAALIPVELVGDMVRDAIQRNQLYLRTHAWPDATIERQREAVWGEGSLGRA